MRRREENSRRAFGKKTGPWTEEQCVRLRFQVPVPVREPNLKAELGTKRERQNRYFTPTAFVAELNPLLEILPNRGSRS